MRFQCLLLVLVFILFASCDSSTVRKKGRERTLTPFEEAVSLGDVCSMADGGAYLTSDRGIYYILSGEAVRVKGVPTSLVLPELYPLPDGSALLKDTLSDSPRIYTLRKDKAIPVKEASQGLSSAPAPILDATSFWFAEAQRFRRQANESADDVDPGSEYDDRGDDSDIR